jgi:DNA-binding CsgD family transcriptional regulator
MIGMVRRLRDFSEHDCLCLNLPRPHILQAAHNLAVLAEAQQEAQRLRQELEASAYGVIALTEHGRIQDMGAHAWRWLEEYFGASARQATSLPEILQRWVAQQTLEASSDDVPPLHPPLVLEQAGKRLVVRLVTEGTGQARLVLHEQRTERSPMLLQSFGLTTLQAEVLFWVAHGKTNAEVGAILGMRVGTVRKHLEHVYQKLDVDNRGSCYLLRSRSPWHVL